MGPWPSLPNHHMFSKRISSYLKQLCQQLCHLHTLWKTPRNCSLWPWLAPCKLPIPPRCPPAPWTELSGTIYVGRG